jgi:site-specific DNA recombinase
MQKLADRVHPKILDRQRDLAGIARALDDNREAVIVARITHQMIQRCAIYARYSSKQQNPASIRDQIRKCREYAQQRAWIILEEHVYTDASIPGAGTDRSGLHRLLATVQERPRLFDVLLIDYTSRLSRRQADQSNMVDQLRFTGFRLIAVSQGIDTASEQSDVLMTVHGLVDSLYLKKLGKKTHRGMEGRVLNGFHPGGRCFGYRNETVPDGVRLVIEQTEAAIVVRIFELSASGASLKIIAKVLNSENVPPPRARKGKKRPTWCPTGIRAMLRNELYAGKVVWNRSQFVKRPGTNRRVPRGRPRSEWKIIDRPELRIISPELWDRVEERQRLLMAVYGRSGTGIHKASSSPYLLTGFLKCDDCGANLIIVSGKAKAATEKYYGCSYHFNRGACGNGLKIRLEEIERNLFRELQENVLTDEVLEYTIREFTRRIREYGSRIPGEIATMQRRLQEIEHELPRLTAAIAETGHSRFMVEAIRERESKLAQLTHRLKAVQLDTVERNPGNIRDFVKAGLKDLIGLLRTNSIRARAELAKYTTEIRMVRESGATSEPYYVAEGNWNLFGEGEGNFAMVAGEGFEPSTFGL